MQGIYKIIIADKYYYGQSMDCDRRKGQHLNKLKNGKHPNYYMQSAWNKYFDFKFEVIEEVNDASLIDEREQHYIDLYFDEPNCMNLARCAEASARGREVSVETRAKISAFGKGRIHSTEHGAKIGAALSKQVKVTYPNGLFDIFPSAKDAALKFCISQTSISEWCTGKKPQPGSGQVREKTKHISGYIFSYLIAKSILDEQVQKPV
jgi:hypothetical protein